MDTRRRSDSRPTLLTAAVLALLFAVSPQLGRAQTAQAPPFGEIVQVEVVNVEVVVTDRSGQPVVGLSRDDFELRVDGESVEITNFYADAAALTGALRESPQRPRSTEFVPLDEAPGPDQRAHVVLLIDHTRLSAANRKRAFQALREAIDRLDPSALISVVGIEGDLVFYSDFLFDRPAVHRILDDVSKISLQTNVHETERRLIFGELARGISGGIQAGASLAEEGLMVSRIRSYAEQEYARSLQSLQYIERVASTLAGLPGRKLLLYLGEGIPNRPGEGLYVELRNRFAGPERGLPHQDFNSDYSRAIGRFDLSPQMQQLAKSTNRAGVTLYAVDAEGNHGNAIRSALTEQGATSETVSVVTENFREPLEYAAKATGGRLLESSGLLSDQLVEMVEGLQTYYSLGFTPPAGWKKGEAHDIAVKTRAKGLRVRHRQEVILPEDDETEAGATLAALMYQTVDNRLGVRALPADAATPRDDGNTVLPITLQIPIQSLELIPRDEKHLGSLTIFVTTKDVRNHPGPVQKVPFHLAIPDAMIERARQDSAHYELPLVLRPGDQQVAIGVRDDTSGAFSALRLDVSTHSPRP